MRDNVYLVGLMGAGKTTVGRKLARILNRKFIDTDQLLEKRTGVSINHIFEIEGEQGFRERETRLFKEISTDKNTVISTGGGLILNPENQNLMRQTGQIIYLRANIDILWKRLRNCHTRPLLNTPDPKTRLKTLIAQRDPVYLEHADHIVTVSANSAHKTASKISQWLNSKDAYQPLENQLNA